MPELIIVAAAFIIMWLQGFVYEKRWLRGLKMELSLSAGSVTEGDTVIISEILENAKLLPLPWIDVRFQVSGNLVFEGLDKTGAESMRSELFSIGSYRRITRTHRIHCTQRGYYTIKSMSVTGQDILMMRKHVTGFSCNQSLTVYPASVPGLQFSPVYRRVMGSVRARRFINPDPFEFRGVREYQPTDLLRDINHRATAKTGRLMVNVFEPTTSRHVTLILNTEAYSAHTIPEVYETSIRIAATLAEQFLSEGLTVSLITNAANVLNGESLISVSSGAGQGHLQMILEALALIDLTRPAEDISTLIKPDIYEESVYIMISPCDGEHVENAVEGLRSGGHDAVWILPRRSDTRTRVSEGGSLFFWDVH